jgi:hypothetical protein
MKRGIIQSRGLGDILIALPIARYYYDQGDEIIWPICEEFYGSVKDSVAWVTWVPMKTDERGEFFLAQPLKIFKYHAVDPDAALYLYHYLNTVPELTVPELFNILKFDQYKYWKTGVPFRLKWTLDACVARDPAAEDRLRTTLGISPGDRYAVASMRGSSFSAPVPQGFFDPAVRLISVDDHLTDSIFDWRGVIEGAEAAVCVDSALANMIDQLCIEGPRLYWVRRSPWDLTPVLGSQWTIIPTNLPIKDPVRVDPAAEAKKKSQPQPVLQGRTAAQANGGDQSSLTSHVPFKAAGKIPTSFMSALKK